MAHVLLSHVHGDVPITEGRIEELTELSC